MVFHLLLITWIKKKVIVESKKGDIVKPNDIKEVPSLGMPFFAQSYSFGSLFIRFNIIFPGDLSTIQVSTLKTLFPLSPVPMLDDKTEKVTAIDYDAERHRQRREEQQYYAHDEDNNDGDQNQQDHHHGHHHGGAGFQQNAGCTPQ